MVIVLLIAVLLLSVCVDVEAQRNENTFGEGKSLYSQETKPLCFCILASSTDQLFGIS